MDRGIAILISLPISALFFYLIRKKFIAKGRYGKETWRASLWAGLIMLFLGPFMAGFIVGLTARPSPSDSARAGVFPGLPEGILLVLIAFVIGLVPLGILINRRFLRSRKERLSKERPAVPFSSPEALGRWTNALLLATMLLAAIAILSELAQIVLLSRIARDLGHTFDEAVRGAERQEIIGLLQVLLSAGALVAFLIWFHRAHKNLPGLGQKRLLFTPGWAVGFFFVPLFGLFRPFQAIREVWHGSDPGPSGLETTADGSVVRDRPGTPALVGWWWALVLISSIVSIFADRLSMSASNEGTLGGFQTAGVIIVVSSLLFIPSAAITLLLVSRVTKRQIEKARLIGQPGWQADMASASPGRGDGLSAASSSVEIGRRGRKPVLVWSVLSLAVASAAIGTFLLTRKGERAEVPQEALATGALFGVGSTREEVLKIQGPPTSKLEMVWFYEDSQVQFDSDGKVAKIWDVSKNLKVRPEKLP